MQAERLRGLIKDAVKEGVKEAIPCCKIFTVDEIDSLRNVVKVEQHIKGWVLYSIALGMSMPGLFAAGILVLRYFKVI